MKADVTPLVLDVDGTFLRTDMLFECLWAALGKDPLGTLRAIGRNLSNRAALKRDLAEIAELRVDLLPVNRDLKDLVDRNIAAGRRVVLASASDEKLVAELARYHGLDNLSFGSDGQTNLKADAKAQRLIDTFGEAGFDYAGDSRADLAVWKHADNAYLVGRSAVLQSRLANLGRNVTNLGGGWRPGELLRAIRWHQWVKNVLLFLPMLAAHKFDPGTFAAVVLGVAAFSAAASSIYIVNDLLDLEADRLHATKHKRSFASGAVPIRAGMAAFVFLALTAIVIGLALNPAFLAVVVGYMILSLVYSIRWKRMRWVDIATLASLYTLRVVGGAAAGLVFVSGFMLVFIFPIFITLGCVKRLTELTLADTDEKLPGRGYSRADRQDLLNIAWIGVAGALVTFFMYSISDQARLLYPQTGILWLAMIPITMWLARMVRLGWFGKQDYDPIVFALRDKRGIGLLLIILSLMFYSAGLWQRWLGL